MRTIPKNHTKIIAAAFANIVRAECHSLGSQFHGEEMDVALVREQLDRYKFAKLVDHEDGTYTLRVHSNLWYRLYTEAEEPQEEERTAKVAAKVRAVRADGTEDVTEWGTVAEADGHAQDLAECWGVGVTWVAGVAEVVEPVRLQDGECEGCGAVIGSTRTVCWECEDPEDREVEVDPAVTHEDGPAKLPQDPDPEEDLVGMECAVAVNRYRKARAIADGLLGGLADATASRLWNEPATVADLLRFVNSWDTKPGGPEFWEMAARAVSKGAPSPVTKALVLAMLRDAAEAEAREEVAR